MKSVLASLCVLLAAASAAQAQSLPSFGFVGIDRLRAGRAAWTAGRQKELSDVISADYLLIQGAHDAVFGYAQTEAQFKEAAAYWLPVLTAAGLSVGAPTYAEGRYLIPYKTADGRVVRSFLADPKQFPPKDEPALRANMALAQEALRRGGLDVVSARVVNAEVILPTYSLLYLTKPDANADHEIQLRVLKPGDDIDFDVYRGAGVTVVQTPETWMMVYLGPEVGYVGMAAETRELVEQKLAKRKEFLLGEGKRLIADRIVALDDDTYKFLGAIYFFQ